MSKKVAVIMGSDSDFPVVSPAIRRLKQFGIPVEARVMSAHRTPEAAVRRAGIVVRRRTGYRREDRPPASESAVCAVVRNVFFRAKCPTLGFFFYLCRPIVAEQKHYQQ